MSLPNTPRRMSSARTTQQSNTTTQSNIPYNRYYPCQNTCKCLNITVTIQPYTDTQQYSYNDLYNILTTNSASPLYQNDVVIGLVDKVSAVHSSLLEERCIELKLNNTKPIHNTHTHRLLLEVYRCLNCKIDVLASVIDTKSTSFDSNDTTTVSDKLNNKLCAISTKLVYGDEIHRLKNSTIYSDIFNILIRDITKDELFDTSSEINQHQQLHEYQSLYNAVEKSIQSARIASEQRIAQLQATEYTQLMRLERKAKSELLSLIKLIECNTELPVLNLQRNTSYASTNITNNKSPRGSISGNNSSTLKPRMLSNRTTNVSPIPPNNNTTQRNPSPYNSMRTQSPTILEHVMLNNSPLNTSSRMISMSPPQLHVKQLSSDDDTALNNSIRLHTNTIQSITNPLDLNVFPLDEDIDEYDKTDIFERDNDSYDDISEPSTHDTTVTTSDESPVQQQQHSRYVTQYMSMPIQIPVQLMKSPPKTQPQQPKQPTTEISTETEEPTKIIPPHTYREADFWSTEKYRYLPDIDKTSHKQIISHTPNSYAFFNTEQNNRVSDTQLYTKALNVQRKQVDKPIVSALSMSLRNT